MSSDATSPHRLRAPHVVAVLRDFVGQHFLVGGDWGAENRWHSHHYRVELRIEGSRLDRHDYLVDIVAIEEALEEAIGRYRDRTLNDLPEFEGRNPSVELLAQNLGERIAGRLELEKAGSEDPLLLLEARVWEHDRAWASYRWTAS